MDPAGERDFMTFRQILAGADDACRKHGPTVSFER
jgi:hypothetical protein